MINVFCSLAWCFSLLRKVHNWIPHCRVNEPSCQMVWYHKWQHYKIPMHWHCYKFGGGVGVVMWPYCCQGNWTGMSSLISACRPRNMAPPHPANCQFDDGWFTVGPNCWRVGSDQRYVLLMLCSMLSCIIVVSPMNYVTLTWTNTVDACPNRWRHVESNTYTNRWPTGERLPPGDDLVAGKLMAYSVYMYDGFYSTYA